MDTEYLKSQLGRCLTDCLTEVSEKRPLDPIEYMGQWLYKYIENINLKKQVVTCRGYPAKRALSAMRKHGG